MNAFRLRKPSRWTTIGLGGALLAGTVIWIIVAIVYLQWGWFPRWQTALTLIILTGLLGTAGAYLTRRMNAPSGNRPKPTETDT